MPDTDQDGLSDLEEAQRGTDPNRRDSDGDGLTDGQEVHGIGNAFAPGVATNPMDNDSDDDGWNDGIDWYPKDADADDDGIIDGQDNNVTPPPGGNDIWDDIERAATAVATGGVSEIVNAATGGEETVLDQVFDAAAAPITSTINLIEAGVKAAEGDEDGARDALLDSVDDATMGAVDVNVDADGDVQADIGGHVGPSISIDANNEGFTADMTAMGVNVDMDGDGDRDNMGVGATIGASGKDGEAAVTGGVFAGSSTDEGDRHEAGVYTEVDVPVDGEGGMGIGVFGQSRQHDNTVRTEVSSDVTGDFTDGVQIDAKVGAQETRDGVVTGGVHVGATAGGSFDEKTGEVTLDTGVFEDHTIAGVETRNEAGTTIGIDVGGQDGTVGFDAGVYGQSETGGHTTRTEVVADAELGFEDGIQGEARVGFETTEDGTVTQGAGIGGTASLTYDDVTGDVRGDLGVFEDHTVGGVETKNEVGMTAGVDVGRDGTYGTDAGLYSQSTTGEHTERFEAVLGADVGVSDGGRDATFTAGPRVEITHDGDLVDGARADVVVGVDGDATTGDTTVTAGVSGVLTDDGVATGHFDGRSETFDTGPTTTPPRDVEQESGALAGASTRADTSAPAAPAAPAAARPNRDDDIMGVRASHTREPQQHQPQRPGADSPLRQQQQAPRRDDDDAPGAAVPVAAGVGAAAVAGRPDGDPTADDLTAGDPTAATANGSDDDGLLSSAAEMIEDVLDDIADAIDDALH